MDRQTYMCISKCTADTVHNLRDTVHNVRDTVHNVRRSTQSLAQARNDGELCFGLVIILV